MKRTFIAKHNCTFARVLGRNAEYFHKGGTVTINEGDRVPPSDKFDEYKTVDRPTDKKDLTHEDVFIENATPQDLRTWMFATFGHVATEGLNHAGLKQLAYGLKNDPKRPRLILSSLDKRKPVSGPSKPKEAPTKEAPTKEAPTKEAKKEGDDWL